MNLNNLQTITIAVRPEVKQTELVRQIDDSFDAVKATVDEVAAPAGIDEQDRRPGRAGRQRMAQQRQQDADHSPKRHAPAPGHYSDWAVTMNHGSNPK